MRRVRYNVAASLDGSIADVNGGFDWIPEDSTVDFAGLFEKVDTILMGRRTFDLVLTQPEVPWKPNTRVYVVSKSLAPGSVPGVTIVDNAIETAAALRNEQGTGEIWLFGGGQLFATLLAGGQVDAVEVTVVPVLLGAGVPLVTSMIDRTALTLARTHVYPSGMVMLHYSVPEVAH